MVSLEDLTPGAHAKGILPDRWVEVVTSRWFGSTVIELSYRNDAGRPDRVLLYRDNEPGIQLASASPDWTFGANGEIHKLVSDAYRIRHARGIRIRGDDEPAISTDSYSSGEADDSLVYPAQIRRWLSIEEQAQAAAMASDQDVSGTGLYPENSEVEAFFVEAINLLDGQIAVREPGRYEIT